MNIGFVGTGNMGGPMASNMLKAGHQLTVFDLNPTATTPLEQLGATRASDLPSVARYAPVTFLSLPNDAIVESVLFGSDSQPGLINGASQGHVVFDLSTVSPDSTRRNAARAAEHGVRLIDAPVSGSVSGAIAGTLSVMIGATEDDVAPYRLAVESIGTSIFCLGEVGKGNILKLLNNLVALSSQAILCQAMALADRVGVERETAAEVISKSSGGSFILDRKRAAIVAHDYAPGFHVELARKDLRLALQLAEQAGARLDLVIPAERLYDQAVEGGFGKLDSCGVLKILEP
ncbi:MAG: NAD(P)-dependent oxidoreductase [Chloroflexota bacterium]